MKGNGLAKELGQQCARFKTLTFQIMNTDLKRTDSHASLGSVGGSSSNDFWCANKNKCKHQCDCCWEDQRGGPFLDDMY